MLETIVLSKTSIMNVIENSFLFKSDFAVNVQRIERGPLRANIRALRMAKHRFESISTPAGRFVLLFDAILATACHIHETRRGREASVHAGFFLQYITPTRLLLMSMLADASDEGIALTRHMDDEDADCADLNDTISNFVARVRFLFGRSDPQCLKLGYTAHMLQILSTPRTFFVDGQPKTIGAVRGVEEGVIAACLRKLGIWVDLAVEVVSAEFPSWELQQAFAIFSLAPEKRHVASRTTDAIREHRGQCIRRLAGCIGVPAEQLESEWAAHLPTARMVFLRQGCTYLEAWRSALETTGARRSSSEAYPSDALRAVLVRYGTSKISSSGVEQAFARGRAILGDSRLCGSESYEFDTMKVVLDRKPHEQDATIALAREIYVFTFGLARSVDPLRTRVAAGAGRQTVDGTEASWIRERRQSVAAAMPPADTPWLSNPSAPDVERGAGWTEAHEEEMQFNRDKERKRKVEAYRQGELLPEEKDASMAQAAADARGTMAHNFAAKMRKRRRVVAALTGGWPPKPCLQGQKVYIATSVPPDGGELLRAVAGALMTRVVDPCAANILVAPDPAAVGRTLHWAAAMHGLWIATPELLTCGRGSAIKYVAAVSKRRKIWVSQAFQERYPRLFILVAEAALGKWVFLGSKEAFLEMKARCCRQKRSAECIALVTSREAHLEDLRGLCMC